MHEAVFMFAQTGVEDGTIHRAHSTTSLLQDMELRAFPNFTVNNPLSSIVDLRKAEVMHALPNFVYAIYLVKGPEHSS